MENATKALIIAGAILVSILLISVAMMVFNVGRDAADSSTNMGTSSQIQQFNSQFSNYLGDSVSGTNVKSLLETVRTSNVTNDSHKIKINGAETIPSANGISTTKKYKVEAEYGDDGYIDNIKYSAVTTRPSTES